MATDFLFDSIPNGWRAVHLGNVAEVMFSSVDKRIVDGETPVKLCNYTDVFNNRRIHLGMTFMAASAKPVECVRWELKKGDVLFTKDSETPEEIGIPAFVTEDMSGILCGYHLARARPNQELADGAFLAELLRSRQVAKLFAKISNGVTRYGLTLEATNSLPILLPPLAEQRAIAAVLDSIDAAIERTDDVIAATQRLRDSLLHELLTRGVPGWHSSWNYEPGLGTIPASWEVVRLGDVCEPPEYGAAAPAIPYDSSLPRYVRITDITDDGRLRSDDARSANPARVRGFDLRTGDLLFARSGATVGKAYLYQQSDGPCVYAGYLIRFHAVQSLAIAEYVWWFTQSGGYQSWVTSMFRAGAQPNINAQEYSSMQIPLPPLEEQQAIAGMLNAVDEIVDRAREERASLQALKASASEALLTGRVRVGAIA